LRWFIGSHLVRLLNPVPAVTGPINISNPDEFNMIELAGKIAANVGDGNSIEHRPLPQDDPTQRRLDITLAK
jgi:UDP-glucuronate decarboxylase